MTTNFEPSPRRAENEPNDQPDRTHDEEDETDDGAEPVERRPRTVRAEVVFSVTVVRHSNVFTEQACRRTEQREI